MVEARLRDRVVIWSIDNRHTVVFEARNSRIATGIRNDIIDTSYVSTHRPLNRTVSNDLSVRHITGVEQILARGTGFRTLEKTFILKSTIDLIANFVSCRFTSKLIDFVDQLSANGGLRRLVQNVLFCSKADKTGFARRCVRN